MEQARELIFYRHYFNEFFEQQTEKVKVKIDYVLFVRIFCCFDKGKIIVLFNGFQKKTRKTPKQEIELAVKLMNEYFENK